MRRKILFGISFSYLFLLLNASYAIASENPAWRDYINERTFYSVSAKLKTPAYLKSPEETFACRNGTEEDTGETFAGWAFVNFYFMPNPKSPKTFRPNWLSVDFRCSSDVDIEDFVSQTWKWANKRAKAEGNRFVPLKSSREFAELYVSPAFGTLSGWVNGSVISGSNVHIAGSCKIPGSGKMKKEIAIAETCLWNILFAARKSIDLKSLKTNPLQPALEDYQSRLTRDECGNFLSQVNRLINIKNLRQAVRSKMEPIPAQRNIQNGIWFGDYIAKNPSDFEYYESLKLEVSNYTSEIINMLESEKLGTWMDYWIPSGGWEKFRNAAAGTYETNMFRVEAVACQQLFGINIPVVPRIN